MKIPTNNEAARKTQTQAQTLRIKKKMYSYEQLSKSIKQ
jgi:hypothetical protein